VYYDLMKFPLEHENLRWEAGEGLLVVDGRPHLFLRVKLTGTRFPLVAQIPQVWVGNVFAKHVLIDEDGLTVRAYFDQPLPEGETLYFGHLAQAELSFGPFETRKITKLNRARLPKDAAIGYRGDAPPAPG
jgi:hypothetical protein